MFVGYKQFPPGSYSVTHSCVSVGSNTQSSLVTADPTGAVTPGGETSHNDRYFKITFRETNFWNNPTEHKNEIL